MSITFNDRLRQLRGSKCTGVDAVEYEERPADTIYAVGTVLGFEDGTRLSAQFWRLIKDRKPLVSIFDHRQKYGLPEPVDAIGMLEREVKGKAVVSAELDLVTGDLRFGYEGELTLEVFNFTGFEIWDMRFSDGTMELSNYVLQG